MRWRGVAVAVAVGCGGGGAPGVDPSAEKGLGNPASGLVYVPPVEPGAGDAAVPDAPPVPTIVHRMTLGSGVRLRAAPAVDAPEVARLGVGAVLVEQEVAAAPVTVGGKTDRWVRVTTPDGVEGWIFGAFAPPVAVGQEREALLALATPRASDKQVGLAELIDLVAALASAAPTGDAGETAMRLRLTRALALNNLAGRIEDPDPRAPDVASVLRRHRSELYYHEMAGMWAVRPEVLGALQTQAGDTPWGDDIAFAHADALRPGECEGEVACSLGALVETWGDYLRAFPRGRHVPDALTAVSAQLTYLAAEPIPGDARGAVREHVTRLRAALARVEDPQRPAVTARLDAIEARAR
jgi:hypothetical protein